MSQSLLPPFDFIGLNLKLENRLPTVSAGLSLTAIVFVILTCQVGLYFWKTPIHSRDPLWIKGIVIFIWIIQALEVALACHMAALVHSSDSTLAHAQAQKFIWEVALYVGICVTTGCLVHAFFISRIYLLGVNPVHIGVTMVLCIILILEGAFGFTSMLYIIISSSAESKHVVLHWPTLAWLGFSILADVSIAGSICYILQMGRPFISKRLNLLVKGLTKFCIQTGLITSLAAGITVALWTAAQLDPGHLFMSFPMSGIYVTCFMANLIARESYFCHIQIDEDGECFGMATRSIVFATPEGFDKDGSLSSEVNQ